MITPLSQSDPRWSSVKLGSGSLNIGSHGCVVTCLAMLAGTTPDVVNAQLLARNGFTNGDLVNWPVAADVFGLPYEATRTIARFYPCVAETEHYAPKYPQHFFVVLADGRQVDPMGGVIRPQGYYKIKSWRNIGVKANMSASVNQTMLVEKEGRVHALISAPQDGVYAYIADGDFLAWIQGITGVTEINKDGSLIKQVAGFDFSMDWLKRHGEVDAELSAARNTIKELRVERENAKKEYAAAQQVIVDTKKTADKQVAEAQYAAELAEKKTAEIAKELEEVKTRYEQSYTQYKDSLDKCIVRRDELIVENDDLKKEKQALTDSIETGDHPVALRSLSFMQKLLLLFGIKK